MRPSAGARLMLGEPPEDVFRDYVDWLTTNPKTRDALLALPEDTVVDMLQRLVAEDNTYLEPEYRRLANEVMVGATRQAWRRLHS